MEFNVKDIFHILKNSIALIIVLSVLGMSFAGAYTYFGIEPKYTAVAKMYVYNEEGAAHDTISSSDLAVSKALVDTYLVIIESKPVLEKARDILIQKDAQKYGNVTIEALRGCIGGAAINETETFTVTATATDAQVAADVVNAVIAVAPQGIENIVKGASAEVIEYADVPKAADWPMLRNIFLGFVIGFMLAVAYILFKAFFDRTVHGYSEISNNFTLPVLGVVPKNEAVEAELASTHIKQRKKVRITFGHKFLLTDKTSFSVSEAYRAARTNLFYLPIEDACKKIAFTSAIPGEGKTVNSINMAILFAQAGKRVLLIDADMRKPKIKSYLNLDANSGLSEYLAGIVDEPETLKHQTSGIDVIVSGKSSSAPAELLGTTRMSALIKKMEPSYDYIIIDTPPINYVTDAVVISKCINGYILSVRAEYSQTDELKNAIDSLGHVDATVYGTMIIGINPKTDSYGRHYVYGYGKYGYGRYDEDKTT